MGPLGLPWGPMGPPWGIAAVAIRCGHPLWLSSENLEDAAVESLGPEDGFADNAEALDAAPAKQPPPPLF